MQSTSIIHVFYHSRFAITADTPRGIFIIRNIKYLHRDGQTYDFHHQNVQPGVTLGSQGVYRQCAVARAAALPPY